MLAKQKQFQYTVLHKKLGIVYARLAQLVERHIDIVEVTGSSPVSRTK